MDQSNGSDSSKETRPSWRLGPNGEHQEPILTTTIPVPGKNGAGAHPQLKKVPWSL